MNALVLSLVAFGALHAVPALPSLSCRLNKRFGRKTHLIAYSLISTTVMILALNAALASDYMELCPVVAWQTVLTLILFGGLGFLSFGGMFVVDARARQRLGAEWQTTASTKRGPSARGAGSRRTRLRIGMHLIVALVVTIALTACRLGGGHALLLGPDPLAKFAL
jgi:uncharacterized membrane protein